MVLGKPLLGIGSDEIKNNYDVKIRILWSQ